MTLDQDGTAVGEPRQCVPSGLPHKQSYLTSASRTRRAIAEDVEEEDEDDEDDDEDEEDSEDEEDEDEDDEDGPSSSAIPGQPELSRAERRELKKKQAAEKAAAEGEEGEDDLLANPNRVTKKLNISDLAAPRELTRRERYVPPPLLIRITHLNFT